MIQTCMSKLSTQQCNKLLQMEMMRPPNLSQEYHPTPGPIMCCPLSPWALVPGKQSTFFVCRKLDELVFFQAANLVDLTLINRQRTTGPANLLLLMFYNYSCFCKQALMWTMPPNGRKQKDLPKIKLYF